MGLKSRVGDRYVSRISKIQNIQDGRDEAGYLIPFRATPPDSGLAGAADYSELSPAVLKAAVTTEGRSHRASMLTPFLATVCSQCSVSANFRRNE